jgi:hypothetical protein
MYTLQGKTWPTHHTLFTLSPRMALDHTYLTWSTYNNLSRSTNRFGRISLVLRNRNFWLYPQLTGCEGERNWMGTRRSVSRRAGDVVRNSFFSRVVTLSNSVDDIAKGCYTWSAWDTYGWGLYADWAWKVCGVLVGFSPAWCTSIWITVTLGYEYHLFVAVIM